MIPRVRILLLRYVEIDYLLAGHCALRLVEILYKLVVVAYFLLLGRSAHQTINFILGPQDALVCLLFLALVVTIHFDM